MSSDVKILPKKNLAAVFLKSTILASILSQRKGWGGLKKYFWPSYDIGELAHKITFNLKKKEVNRTSSFVAIAATDFKNGISRKTR